MPQVVVAAKAVWAVWTAWAAQHVVTAFVIKTLATVAISAGIGKAFAPKLGGGALSSGSPLQMSRDPAPARSVVYGEIRKSGPLLDAFISGTKNEFLHMVVGLAATECEAIGSVYFNDAVEALDGSGNSTGTYAGFARIKKKLGVTGQAADSDFVADSGGQRASTDKFDRTAYIYGKFKWDQDKWPGGFPNLSAMVKGRKCHDPRTATTVWTDNPALCVRDYLTNLDFGLAVDAGEIDDASFIEAANICDEAVALAAGGTEKRYRCNGTFETTAEPATVLEKLVESMAGAVVYVGGKWICYAGAHRTPESSHLTEDDLRGPISVQTKLSLRDTCNRVRGTFSSPDEKYQPADFVPIVNSTYLAEDGGIEIWRDLNFAFVTSHSQSQRLAKIDLELTRQDISVQMPCKLTALRYKPGDVVPVDNAEMGWSGKLFRVTSLKFSPYDAGGKLQLGVDLVLRETAAECWEWNSGMETTYDPAANTNLLNTLSVPTPAGLALALASAAERTALPRIKVSWTLPSDQFVLSGGFTVIEYKKHADSTWLEWSRVKGNVNVDFINDLQVGTNTDVRLKHINNARVESAYCTTVSLVAAAGEASYQVALTNSRHGVASNAEGTVLAGELGSGGRATTDVKAWAGSLALAAVGSGPVVGQFAFTAAVIDGTATITKVDADTVRVDTMGSDRVVVRCTFDLEGLSSRDEDWVLWKNTSGGAYWLLCDTAAVNKTIAGAYTPTIVNFTAMSKLATSAPAAYAGRLKIDTWNGATWTNVYNSASNETTKAYTVPAGVVAFRCQLYLAGSFSTFLDEQVVPITNDGQTGAAGPAGANTAVVFLYQRAASAPSVPAGALTYTFASGALSGTLGSWSQTVPADNGQPCFVTTAVATASGTTDSIATGEWATPVIHTQSGVQSAPVFLYQRAASTPALPGSTLTYTFASGALSGTLGSWSQTVPAVNGNPCYVTQATALAPANATTDSIGTGEWSAAVKLVQDGAAGATGATGGTGPTGATGPAGSSAPKTHTPSVVQGTAYVAQVISWGSPPSGYVVQYSVNGGNTVSKPASSIPFNIILGGPTTPLLIWATAPGESPSDVLETNWNSL